MIARANQIPEDEPRVRIKLERSVDGQTELFEYHFCNGYIQVKQAGVYEDGWTLLKTHTGFMIKDELLFMFFAKRWLITRGYKPTFHIERSQLTAMFLMWMAGWLGPKLFEWYEAEKAFSITDNK